MSDAKTLSMKKCVPCEGGVEPLSGERLAAYTPATPDWQVVDGVKIEKTFKFKNFKEAMAFINHVAEIAEAEGHHPDISLYDWNNVKLSLSTHAIKGLSENDFILAVKINLIKAE